MHIVTNSALGHDTVLVLCGFVHPRLGALSFTHPHPGPLASRPSHRCRRRTSTSLSHSLQLDPSSRSSSSSSSASTSLSPVCSAVVLFSLFAVIQYILFLLLFTTNFSFEAHASFL